MHGTMGLRGLRFVGCRVAAVLAAAVLAAAPDTGSAGPLLPLRTLAPETEPAGTVSLRVGAGYSTGERLMFQDADLNRAVLETPSLELAIGVSENVELRLQYAYLHLQQDGAEDAFGSGDLRVLGIFSLLGESPERPGCALMLGAKAPNAEDQGGFGTDQSDLFVSALFSKKISMFTVLLNAGMAILDNPSMDTTEQDDVLTYGAGLACKPLDWLTLGCEVDGLANSHNGNERGYVRGGAAVAYGDFAFDVSGGVGLNDASGSFHVGAGLTYRYDGTDSPPAPHAPR